MSKRVHLYVSAEPAGMGKHLQALCGFEVRDAQAVSMFDGEVVSVQFSLGAIKGLCKDCAKQILPSHERPELKSGYVYGIREGEEVAQEGFAISEG